MNGTNDCMNGAATGTNGAAITGSRLKRVASARERFAAGADAVRGVRPEILMSWYRCREEYEVDPGLDRAPAAAEVSAHSIEHDVVFAELGGLAAAAGAEVGGLDGLVTVADPDGRILAVWGSRRIPSPGRGEQPCPLVDLVRVGLRHQRHGHRARKPPPGHGQRPGALVPGLPSVGVRRCRGP